MQPLSTEELNPNSALIDTLPTEEVLRIINAADQEVARSVQLVIPAITEAVDRISELLADGGTLFYVGAGTSGRLGVLDASECPPTFNVPATMVQGIIAGGDSALRTSSEKAEDDPAQGAADLRSRDFDDGDVLVGIAASGRTPYVLGAVEYARGLGALTVGISCTENSKLAGACEIAITPIPGPEVIAGSTRMRAGTATKLVLNMISTGTMVRLGMVYGNLMVNVQPTNDKLTDRACRILASITGISLDAAPKLLESAGGSVRTAILMSKGHLSRNDAEVRLAQAKGRLREALSPV